MITNLNQGGGSSFTTSKLSIAQEEYLRLEADKLNKEVEKLMEETRSREKYSLTIIAGVAAGILTNLEHLKAHKFLMESACFIPLVTTIIYALSVYFLTKNVLWIGHYLKQTEDHFYTGAEAKWGWEKYFAAASKRAKYSKITKVIWLFQLILAAALGIFSICYNVAT